MPRPFRENTSLSKTTRELPLRRGRKRNNPLLLGGKLKVGVLYLGNSPVCQGRVPGFFWFCPCFLGFSYMYLRVSCDMLRCGLRGITMGCGVDAVWTERRRRTFVSGH